MKLKNIAVATSVASTLVAAYFAAGMTALNYAAKRKPETTSSFNPGNIYPIPEEDKAWIAAQKFENISITTFDGLKLNGVYLPAAKKSDKVLIAVHGYRASNFKDFSFYLRFYHELGFNVLMPDNRAHGLSEGQYVGFGWLDRLDLMEWIKEIKNHFNNQPLQIVLHGISMGAAAVLMASGENLPDDVKCIVSDCSYTSAEDEFKKVLHEHHIPSFMLLPAANMMSSRKIGYDFRDASAIKQVAKSHTPTLFIHGDEDELVPDDMAYALYNACSAPKDFLIIKGANHADGYMTDRDLYQNTIQKFFNQYLS